MTRRSRDLFRLNDSANSNKDSPFENSTRLKSRPIKNVKYSITNPKSQSETIRLLGTSVCPKLWGG